MTEEEKKQQKELWKQDHIRERKEEWQKIKSLGFGARVQYLWDYYKIVLVIAIVAVFVVYLIVNVIQGARTDTVLYACFLNSDELDPDTEGLREAYIQSRGGLEKMQEITFDSSIYVDPDSNGTSQRDVATMIKITSFVGAGAVDVFLTPSYVTEFEQENGLFLPLEDVLTAEEIQKLGQEGCLYYAEEPETESLSGSGEQRETEQHGRQPETGQAAGSQGQPGTDQAAGSQGQPDTDQAVGSQGQPDTDQAAGSQGQPGTDQAAGLQGQTDGGTLTRNGEYPLNTQPGNGSHIYAVRVDQAGVIGDYSIYADRQVWFSIIGNSSRTEEALRFLHFLLGRETPEKEAPGSM